LFIVSLSTKSRQKIWIANLFEVRVADLDCNRTHEKRHAENPGKAPPCALRRASVKCLCSTPFGLRCRYRALASLRLPVVPPRCRIAMLSGVTRDGQNRRQSRAFRFRARCTARHA
jgi:hypothetical protein